MSTITGFNYDYVFNLAARLSPEEQARLLRELPNGTSSKPVEKYGGFLSEPEETPYSPDEFYEFLLRGPVIDEEHIEFMLDAREEVNRCRPISW
jgi:hypothetical protein